MTPRVAIGIDTAKRLAAAFRTTPELRRIVESGSLGEQVDALRAFGADDACWPAPAKAVA